MTKKHNRQLTGDGQQVKPGQEYRILSYDRKLDEYRFILLDDRREGFVSNEPMLGGKVKIMRYMPENGYVFKTLWLYPSFFSLEDAKKWAEVSCDECREIPSWWKVEDNRQIKRLSKNAHEFNDTYDEDHWRSHCCDYAYKDKRRSRQELDYHI